MKYIQKNISVEIRKELDVRLKNLEEGHAQLYSLEQVKDHIRKVKQKLKR